MAAEDAPVVLLIHGLGGTRYDLGALPRRLAAAGFATASVTLPGHATTPEDLNGVRVDDWLEAVRASYRALAAAHRTVHVVGMCMGALLAIEVCKRETPGGGRLVALAAPVFLDGWSTPWYWALRHLVYRLPMLAERMRVAEEEPYGIRNEQLRSIVRRKFERGDTFAYGWVPLGCIREVDRLRRRVMAGLERVAWPTLLVAAREDELTSLRSARFLRDGIGRGARGRPPRLVVLENSYHLICVDNDKELVARSVIEFLAEGDAAGSDADAPASSHTRSQPGRTGGASPDRQAPPLPIPHAGDDTVRPALFRLFATALAASAAAASYALPSDMGRAPVASPPDTVGPNPRIAPVDKKLLPTMQIAPAKGWPAGAKPVAAAGVAVGRYAEGLNHPRWVYVLPNGDVLVAETNSPPKPDDNKGVKGKVTQMVQGRAGAGTLSSNRIVLLRDADGDGKAELKSVFIAGLNSPFGMVLVGNDLYVAETDAIVRFPYTEGATKIDAKGVKLTDLPGGPINHHWTKNVIASADGSKLYATVGSNSNVAENGIAAEEGRAAIWEVDRASGQKQLYATGLRNPNGMAWFGDTLWTVANERDELGNDLVPDYLTSVQRGGFYGWPYSYYGQHVDDRVKDQRPDLVAKAIPPDYALGAHVAALGLVASSGATMAKLPDALGGEGVFIGEHGSWNRKPAVGYKVVFVPFSGGKPAGQPVDVLTGFVNQKGEANGRPVGVAIDKKGGLLVADDVGGVVWRASAAAR